MTDTTPKYSITEKDRKNFLKQMEKQNKLYENHSGELVFKRREKDCDVYEYEGCEREKAKLRMMGMECLFERRFYFSKY
jgi:hypothetical protein